MSQDKLLYMLPKITHSRLYAIVISNIKTIIVICHVFFITFVKFVSFTCIRTQIYTNCFIALLLPYPLRFLLTYPNIDILGQWLDSKIIQNGDCKMATSLHQSGVSPWASSSTLLASLSQGTAGHKFKQSRMEQ